MLLTKAEGSLAPVPPVFTVLGRECPGLSYQEGCGSLYKVLKILPTILLVIYLKLTTYFSSHFWEFTCLNLDI